MQFELSGALIDEILFFMEDQNGYFVLDTRESAIVDPDEDDDFDDKDEGRYISLPDWGPSDGFRLMEHFTAGLRNALVREELSAALNRGRGVFRAFKDALSPYPEVEKLWFDYKDRAMKREVIAWYNALRESWGLELIGEEPEDIAGLALEDFRFRQGMAQDSAPAKQVHTACLGEDAAAAIVSCMGEWVFPGDVCFVAETAGGEFAGYINAVLKNDNADPNNGNAQGGTTLVICAVEVQAEYRGLGLGKALVSRLLEYADHAGIPRIIIDLPAGQDHFSRALLREDFKLSLQRYCRESK